MVEERLASDLSAVGACSPKFDGRDWMIRDLMQNTTKLGRTGRTTDMRMLHASRQPKKTSRVNDRRKLDQLVATKEGLFALGTAAAFQAQFGRVLLLALDLTRVPLGILRAFEGS